MVLLVDIVQYPPLPNYATMGMSLSYTMDPASFCSMGIFIPIVAYPFLPEPFLASDLFLFFSSLLNLFAQYRAATFLLPIKLPVALLPLATIALFTAVGRWKMRNPAVFDEEIPDVFNTLAGFFTAIGALETIMVVCSTVGIRLDSSAD